MTARLPLGMLGVAHVHAAGYAAWLRAAGSASLVGFVEPDDTLAAAFARATGARRLADAAALAAAGARAVIVAGDNAQSGPALAGALASGLPALAEKPLGLDPDATAPLVRGFAAAGLPLATAFPMRFAPSVTALRDAVRAGELGEVVALVGENVGRFPGLWFGDPARSGGGCLTDHVSHLADLFGWILGRAPVAVTTVPGCDLDNGTERTAGLVLDYPDGVYATIDPSWARPESYPTWGGLSLSVVGRRGTGSARPFARRVDAWLLPPRWLRDVDDLDAAMLADFVRAVRSGGVPRATGMDGLAALRVVRAAQASLRSGRPSAVDRTGGAGEEA